MLPCPYRKPKPKQLTDARESIDSPIDERSLQIDLVRLDRGVPAAGRAGSRNPCSSTPAQYPAAQMPETSGPQQHRPAAACWALSAGSRGAWCSEDYKAEDADTLAPRRLSSLLALEIATARRSASDTGGHSRDEYRKVHGEKEDAAVAGLEDLPSQSCRWHCIDGSVPGPDDLV